MAPYFVLTTYDKHRTPELVYCRGRIQQFSSNTFHNKSNRSGDSGAENKIIRLKNESKNDQFRNEVILLFAW